MVEFSQGFDYSSEDELGYTGVVWKPSVRSTRNLSIKSDAIWSREWNSQTSTEESYSPSIDLEDQDAFAYVSDEENVNYPMIKRVLSKDINFQRYLIVDRVGSSRLPKIPKNDCAKIAKSPEITCHIPQVRSTQSSHKWSRSVRVTAKSFGEELSHSADFLEVPGTEGNSKRSREEQEENRIVKRRRPNKTRKSAALAQKSILEFFKRQEVKV